MSVTITTAIESEFTFAVQKADKQELQVRRYKIEIVSPYPTLSVRISVATPSKLKQVNSVEGFKAATVVAFIYQELVTFTFDSSFQLTVKISDLLSNPITGTLLNCQLENDTQLTNNAMKNLAWFGWKQKLNSSLADLNGWDQWLNVAMNLIDKVEQSNSSTVDLLVANNYTALSKTNVLETIVLVRDQLILSNLTCPLSLGKIASCASKLLVSDTKSNKQPVKELVTAK